MAKYLVASILLFLTLIGGKAFGQIDEYKLDLTKDEMQCYHRLRADRNMSNMTAADSFYTASKVADHPDAMIAALDIEIRIYLNQSILDTIMCKKRINELIRLSEETGNTSTYFYAKSKLVTFYRYTEDMFHLLIVSQEIIKDAQKMKSAEGLYIGYKSIAQTFLVRDNPRLSKQYFLKALEMGKKFQIPEKDKGIIYTYISMIYDAQHQFDSAAIYLEKARSFETGNCLDNDLLKLSLSMPMDPKKYCKEYERILAQCDPSNEIGEFAFYLKAKYMAYRGKADSAKFYCYKTGQLDSLNQLSEINIILGNWKDAYQYKFREQLARDSMLEAIQNSDFAQMDAEMNNAQLKMETDRLSARNRLTIIVAVLGFIIISAAFIIGIFIAKHKRQKEIEELLRSEVLRQTAMLKSQKEEIETQRDSLLTINAEITSSIKYAKLIQCAAVPSEEDMSALFDKFMIMWRPLNIVSGDFYWATKVGNRKYIAVADCTGHGVPGGFLSMLGISILNELSKNFDSKTTAADILNNLRNNIIEALKQSNSFSSSQDGMDMALCIVDDSEMELQYSGANRPLVLVRNGEAQTYKPQRMPIGIYVIMDQFENQTVKIEKGDWLYMFSDGIQDQFGYRNGDRKKFSQKVLVNILATNCNEPPDVQSQKLSDVIDKFRSPSEGIPEEQIDDELVIGVTI